MGLAAHRALRPANTAPAAQAIATTATKALAAWVVNPAVRENTRWPTIRRIAAAAACARYKANAAVGTARLPTDSLTPVGLAAPVATDSLIEWGILSSAAARGLAG